PAPPRRARPAPPRLGSCPRGRAPAAGRTDSRLLPLLHPGALFLTMADGTPLPATTPETASFHSFDGGYCETAAFHRPARYRAVEAAAREGRVIPRGGGYSYAAASFGGGSLVLDMTRL